jgi:hypothetical protein
VNTTVVIKARVSSETKRHVAEAAQRELLTESVWLRRAVNAALQKCPPQSFEIDTSTEPRSQSSRISIRLPEEDRRLLDERATARGMPVATYVSVLTRSHLRHLSPLPKAELLTLRAAVSELGAIGRNLNQIARAANQGARLLSVERGSLEALLKVCQGLRDHVKKLIQANLSSWANRHAEARR